MARKFVIPDVVKVQDQESGKWFDVKASNGTNGWSCSCGARWSHLGCEHVQRANDVHSLKCETSRYDMVSAMHKEIRRGDIEKALYWGDLLSRHSPSYVKNYVRKITFEETSNFDLASIVADPGQRTYRDLICMIAASPKKWEHEGSCVLFREKMRAWIHIQTLDEDEVSAEGAMGWLKNGVEAQDAFDAYVGYWILESMGETIEAFDVAKHANRYLATVAEASSSWVPRLNEIVAVVERDNLSPSYMRDSLLSVIFGAWDDSLQGLTLPMGFEMPFDRYEAHRIERIPDYAFDWHTRVGRKLLREFGHLIKPEAKLPKKLDPRWSGRMDGVAWRHAAWQQHGSDLKEVPWGDVEMSKSFWDNAWAHAQA